MLMTALASAIGSPGYLSSEYIKPAAIVQFSAGTSPNGSDLNEAVINSLMEGLVQAENTLLDWFRDPSALDDDDTDSLSRDTIRNALTFTQRLKASLSQMPDYGHPLPLRAVTVGTEGAISLEFASGTVAVTYVFKADGSTERMVFVSNRLLQRDLIALS
ncbi:MAG: hypothetical protein IPM33_01870 [Phycisphaerales bacterium]|nr:hypothetical protein [Phycisphaerales bacterium]